MTLCNLLEKEKTMHRCSKGEDTDSKDSYVEFQRVNY